MIILWKIILISFYKVDLENQPFDPNIVWRYTLKRFADLALALAHDARTKQLSSTLVEGNPARRRACEPPPTGRRLRSQGRRRRWAPCALFGGFVPNTYGGRPAARLF
eukprot:scaffold11310_cov107-Isochrysis_galbana.AAC.12